MGLGIAILVGMWPFMYVDVNVCNLCSICMFLILDFGFNVSYCRGSENGFAIDVRLSIVAVSFCF